MNALRTILNLEVVRTVYRYATEPAFMRDNPQHDKPEGEDEEGQRRVGRGVPPNFRRLPEKHQASELAIKRSKKYFQGRIPPQGMTFWMSPPQRPRKPGEPKPWPFVVRATIENCGA